MKEQAKTRVLTQEQHDARVANGCCPVCMSNLRRAIRVKKSGDGERLDFCGSYMECSSDDAWKCYYLSPGSGKNPPRELASAPPVVISSGPAVIKRRKAA